MGSKKAQRGELERLAAKTLDEQFMTEIRDGLNCSAFEAHAVLEVVHEVFAPYFSGGATPVPPGQVSVVVVDADEPAGKPLRSCAKKTVCLTIHRGPKDDEVLRKEGPEAFRRARIPELCQQALSQGGLLTREDLAYRILFVSPRTISRDFAALRRAQPKTPIPLRSTVQDIGPVLTHRVEIVRLALEGKTMSEICKCMHHSPSAVANYLSTFARCAQLKVRGMDATKIAFLLERSATLIESYLVLVDECAVNETYAYHLLQIEQFGQVTKKKSRRTLR